MGDTTSPEAIQGYDINVKIVVLGESAVGKTSILLRYCDGVFNENLQTTLGVDIKSKYCYYYTLGWGCKGFAKGHSFRITTKFC